MAASDLVRLRSRGAPVVALAAIYQHSPLVLLTAEEAGIESIHDLVGARCRTAHQTLAENAPFPVTIV